MSKHHNKWIHGKTNLVMPAPPNGFMVQHGIYYLNAVLDKEVGEEVVLIIYDPTDFIYEVEQLVPFNFYVASFVINTAYGPVFSFLFWVTNTHDKREAFAIYDKPIDISRPTLIQPWIKIANQTHVHLLLIDKNYETVGFYEFDNVLGFEESVNTILQLDTSNVMDYICAEQEYFSKYSLEDLFEKTKNNS